MNTIVELEGVNGERFTLAGPDAGDRGVYLGTGVTGLYDPPVKAVYEEPGNYPGSRYLNHRVLRRDVIFGVEILNDKGSDSWLSRDSEWRKAWAFDRDCKLYITTEDSGTRYLKLRLFESPDVSLLSDPNGNSVNRVGMVCVAGDPFWYEDDVVYTATTTTDTRFDPNPLPWPWPQTSLPSETLAITVDPADGRGGLNPTDQYVFPKWSVPGSTQAPSEPYIPGIPWLGAPKSRATIWTLPDYSFEDPDQATRRVRLPALIGGLRTNEVQAFNLDGRPTGGTFTIGLGTETTTALAYNASVGTVKAALEALASIAYDEVLVERGSVSNEVQVVNLTGGPTGGTFKLTFAGSSTGNIPFNASDFDVFTALGTVTGALNATVRSKVTNEVQVVQVAGEPTGGTFTLTFDGQTTGNIPWNAGPLVVKLALLELTNIDLLDVFVGSDIFTPHSPYYLTFGGKYTGINMQTITGDATNLTGGAGIDIQVTTKTQGSRPYVITFGLGLSGLNVPEMTTDSALLTGGVSPKASVVTDAPGSWPYLITFRNGLSGANFPLLTVNPANLLGSSMAARSWKNVEGAIAPAENCVVDSDPRSEQIVSESGSSVWSRMNGVRFRNPIPPWTKSKTFSVSVSGCPVGQMVSLRLPRPWSRPWGLE